MGDDLGFRQGLDLGLMAGLKSYDGGSSSGSPQQHQRAHLRRVEPHRLPASIRRIIAGEIGGGGDNAFTGKFAVIGLAVRVDPKAGGGVGLRVGGDVYLVDVGFQT